MPRRSKPRQPQLCHHKPSGKAYVRMEGRHGPTIYLGEYGSPQSQFEYDRLIAKWKAKYDPDGFRRFGTTIGELYAEFIQFAETYYRQEDGTHTTSTSSYRQSCEVLLAQFKYLPAAEFDLVKLEAVRDVMIRKGDVRSQINKRVHLIRRMFEWGVRRKIGTPAVLAELDLIEPLKPGRSKAVESEPVLPVPQIDIDAVLPRLTLPLRAMILLYLRTGARVSELRLMKVGNVDRSGDIWEYRPKLHKTRHHGKVRVVMFDPIAQEILLPYLLRPADAYCFNPEEGRREFVAANYRDGADAQRTFIEVARCEQLIARFAWSSLSANATTRGRDAQTPTTIK